MQISKINQKQADELLADMTEAMEDHNYPLKESFYDIEVEGVAAGVQNHYVWGDDNLTVELVIHHPREEDQRAFFYLSAGWADMEPDVIFNFVDQVDAEDLDTLLRHARRIETMAKTIGAAEEQDADSQQP